MAERKRRYVLLCQQAFAFATVAAVGISAAGVVELHIVAPGDADAAAGPRRAVADTPALVSSAPVAPHVRTVPLGGSASGGMSLPGAGRRTSEKAVVLSAAESATGFATIGVTWDGGQDFGDDALEVSVRSLRDGVWSDWQQVPYDPDHDPDPGAEGDEVRDGTDAVVVGDVDDVQVKAVSSTGQTPEGLALAIVDPGADVAPTREEPAIDTGKLASSARLAGSPATVTPKPKIFSRKQWGADERLRDPGSLHYGEVHAGFVHHTVNANGYSRDEVPSILRGIYAYHTQSRGWSDVGYNYLVDRFGRIWEGRFGGVARPVVGAHTLGFNDDAFAMSAIGNFETVRPSQVMLNAYAKLFAWKLSLHGIKATDAKQFVSSRNFRAINGHRDAGATACPGRYLYEKIPWIRNAAADLQTPWKARGRHADLSGRDWPDLVVRDAATQHALFVRTHGQDPSEPARAAGERPILGRIIDTGTTLKGINLLLNVGDWNGDGHGDVMTRDASSGVLSFRAGLGSNQLADPVNAATGWGRVSLVTPVGDMTGDGYPDLVGRYNGSFRVYPSNGKSGFKRSYVIHSNFEANRMMGVGLWDGNGTPDVVVRHGDGSLWRWASNGPGGLTTSRRVGGGANQYDRLKGIGDVDGDGRADLVGRDRSDGSLYLLPREGNGFGPRRLIGTGFGSYDLVG